MIWKWLQTLPVVFRVAFFATLLTMAGGFLFNFIGHDGIGALLGLVTAIVLAIVKRKELFAPQQR